MTTTILVCLNDVPVGAIQSFTLKEFKSVEDGYSTNCKIEGSRMVLDKTKIAELFSRGFVHEKAQIYPIQIIVKDDVVVTKIHNAWFNAIDYTYTTGDWIILENLVLEAEEVTGEISPLEPK